MSSRVNGKDVVAGLSLLALSAYCGFTASAGMKIGTPGAMGPGFFPFMVSVGLGALAVMLLLRGLRGPAPWPTLLGLRPLVCILGAPATFGLLIGLLGFVPVTALASFIAALADSRMTLAEAAAISAFLTVLSTALFVYALQMTVPLFGSLLTG